MSYIEHDENHGKDKIVVKATGCPWCNEPPKITVDESKMFYIAQCINKKCHVNPKVTGAGYEHVAKLWSKRAPEIGKFEMDVQLKFD